MVLRIRVLADGHGQEALLIAAMLAERLSLERLGVRVERNVVVGIRCECSIKVTHRDSKQSIGRRAVGAHERTNRHFGALSVRYDTHLLLGDAELDQIRSNDLE